MLTEFHRYLFEHIRRNAKPETVLAQELMAMLQQSKANIYKKINGKVPFSGEEIIVMARHYGISLDQHIHNGHSDFDKVSFDYSLPQHQPRTNWKLPELLNSAFNPDEIYERWPALEEHRQATNSLYKQIPSIEYWPRIILNNFLNQIRYYASVNLFQDPKMPALLHAELIDMLDDLEQFAKAGNKGLLPNGQKAANFQLYLNEIAFSTHIILIYNADKPAALYTTVDHPNFMRTTDVVFCGRMHQWVSQIEECSFSLSNEQHRVSLFKELKENLTMVR